MIEVNHIKELSKEEKNKQYQREWYLKNKEKLRCANRESARRYYQKHSQSKEYKERQRDHAKRRRVNNKGNPIVRAKQRELNIRYFNNPINKEIIKEKVKNRLKQRLKIDDNYRLRRNLRGRIKNALKNANAKKHYKTHELLGCTVLEAKQHIESLWLPGMNWYNHCTDGWHIDHIKPCNTFNLTDPEQQKQCFHYTNLRPLWARDNIRRPIDGSDIIHQ